MHHKSNEQIFFLPRRHDYKNRVDVFFLFRNIFELIFFLHITILTQKSSLFPTLPDDRKREEMLLWQQQQQKKKLLSNIDHFLAVRNEIDRAKEREGEQQQQKQPYVAEGNGPTHVSNEP